MAHRPIDLPTLQRLMQAYLNRTGRAITTDELRDAIAAEKRISKGKAVTLLSDWENANPNAWGATANGTFVLTGCT